MEGLLFILLLVKEMNKLLKFYWKKETQMLILQLRFFFIILMMIFFSLFSLFSFSVFIYQKSGTTPLYIAAEKGYEQIVKILLEKGGADVNFKRKVLSLSFFFWYLNIKENFVFCDENQLNIEKLFGIPLLWLIFFFFSFSFSFSHFPFLIYLFI